MTQSRTELIEINAKTVNQTVPLGVIVPPGFVQTGSPLPLCIFLHGGGGDRSMALEMQPMYEAMWTAGTLAPMVIVSASTGPLSWYAGPWEEFIAAELPEIMAGKFGTRSDPAGTVLTGLSMGGLGTLKIAFRRPDRFAAIAALEPGIEPGLRRVEASPRNTFYRFPESDSAMWGNPIDEKRWQNYNPANIAQENADTIRASEMEIYLEAGDEDDLNLHDGTEFLHRILWDLDIRHEYHCVRWAGHVGSSLGARFAEAMRFLTNALNGGLSAPKPITPTADEQKWIDWMNRGMAGEAPALDMSGDRAPGLLDRLMAPKKDPAHQSDPSSVRAYAQMPKIK
jgi:S-formylglutathione hydrolase